MRQGTRKHVPRDAEEDEDDVDVLSEVVAEDTMNLVDY